MRDDISVRTTGCNTNSTGQTRIARACQAPAVVKETAVHHECIILADSPEALSDRHSRRRSSAHAAAVLGQRKRSFSLPLQTFSRNTSRILRLIGRRSRSIFAVAPAIQLPANQIVDALSNRSELVIVLRGTACYDSDCSNCSTKQNANVVLVDSHRRQTWRRLVAARPGNKARPVFLCRGRSFARLVEIPSRPLEKPLAEAHAGGNRVEGDRHRLLATGYHASLRRRLHPSGFPAPAPEQRRIAERLLLSANAKGVARFSRDGPRADRRFSLSRVYWKTAITPNQLTVMNHVVAWGATFLFATGRLGWERSSPSPSGSSTALMASRPSENRNLQSGKAGALVQCILENSWWIALGLLLPILWATPQRFRLSRAF